MIAYKYKLYTTRRTKHLDAMLREASWVWNHALALQKRYYSMYKKYIPLGTLQKKWVRWHDSRLLHSQTVQEILERLDAAYDRFFKHNAKRPPKFKSARFFTSFLFKQGGYTLNGNVLTINKTKTRYKFALSRPYDHLGKPQTVRIRRTPLGEFFVTLTFRADAEPIGKTHNGASVGIDFGLKTYMTLSTGERIQSPRYLKQGLAQLRRHSRALSKKQKGSNNRERARRDIDRLHEQVVNRRHEWQWQLAHDLCRRYDTICIEDLSLVGMSALWGRKMADLAHAAFVCKLEYLAGKYGVTVQKVDRYFPSSKLCDCGHVYNELTLRDRHWTCPVCGREHDRDLHAACNILRQGIASLGSTRKTRNPVKVSVQVR